MNVKALKRIGNSLINLRDNTDDISDQNELTKLITAVDMMIIESDIK